MYDKEMNTKMTKTGNMAAFQVTQPLTLTYWNQKVINKSPLRNQRIHSLPTRHIRSCTPSPLVTEPKDDALTAAGITLILRRAVKAYTTNQGTRPSAKVLKLCLKELEQVQKRNKHLCDINNLYGQWRLIYITSSSQKSTSTSFYKDLYFPLQAHQTFIKHENDDVDDDGVFDNGVFLLGKWLYFRVCGPMRWVGKMNRLEFSVDSVKWHLGPFGGVSNGLDKEGYSLHGRTAKTLPFFTFCCIRGDIAVARGRSGGMALYARVADDEHL